MKISNRLLGGILLVSGTAIGAGMLALPVTCSFGGFFPSLGLLAVAWAFLFATSWLLLDVNLSFRGEVNLVSMVGRSLGLGGKVVCWIAYLMLLYSLTAAYIAGSTPLFLSAIYMATGCNLPLWIGPFPLLILFGIFVYLGTESVDRINRILMLGLTCAYFFLIAALPSHIQTSLILHVDLSASLVAIPIIMTSFGFHIIIPTLTTYLDHDIKKLRLTLFIGSGIPFLVYAIWNFLILGVVPLRGADSLVSAWKLGQTGVDPLVQILHSPSIIAVAKTFSFFAIITSFLGVSLSLSDFLTDGLRMKRFSFGRELASLLTFIPPLFFVILYPRGFLMALEYAGFFVVVLLCLFPALMAWKLPQYRTPWRRLLLLCILLLSLFVIGLDILEEVGVLRTLIQPYV